MIHWEFSHLPFDGDYADDKIVCQNCGWSWNVKDGGDDLFICHKCNYDNSKFYNSNFEGGSKAGGGTAGAIIGGVTALLGLGSSIAQSKTSKQMSKSDLQKEVDLRCGKDKSKGLRSKKVKQKYNDCKNSVLQQIDTDKQSSSQKKQKQEEFQQNYLLEQSKQKRTQTYIIIGVVAVILGVDIYKKMNK
jgi:hypothetical protein